MRSFLFVPADSERKLAKGPTSGPDGLILDLEDSVAPDAHGLVELSGAVAGSEQEGAQHHTRSRFSMKACRRHSATSVPSWL